MPHFASCGYSAGSFSSHSGGCSPSLVFPHRALSDDERSRGGITFENEALPTLRKMKRRRAVRSDSRQPLERRRSWLPSVSETGPTVEALEGVVFAIELPVGQIIRPCGKPKIDNVRLVRQPGGDRFAHLPGGQIAS